MKAFVAIFEPAAEGGDDDALVMHLKSYSRHKEVMPGVWVIMSAKSAGELNMAILKHRQKHPVPAIAVFRIDGSAMDWDLSGGVDGDSRAWLFDNLSYVFPRLRLKKADPVGKDNDRAAPGHV